MAAAPKGISACTASVTAGSISGAGSRSIRTTAVATDAVRPVGSAKRGSVIAEYRSTGVAVVGARTSMVVAANPVSASGLGRAQRVEATRAADGERGSPLDEADEQTQDDEAESDRGLDGGSPSAVARSSLAGAAAKARRPATAPARPSTPGSPRAEAHPLVRLPQSLAGERREVVRAGTEDLLHVARP